MHLPTRNYTTIEWYEYRNYTMNNTGEKQLTIDEYFDQQKEQTKSLAQAESTEQISEGK